VKILCLFFQQVAKEYGKLYPPGSIHNLFSPFQRILRRAQELCIMESGVNENLFNMKSDPQFCRVVLACILALRRSRKAGVGVVRKQVHFVPPSFCWAGQGWAGLGWAGLGGTI
jgi:hypothetical protein